MMGKRREKKILISEKALEMLNNARGKRALICVGNTAEKIAEALNLDIEKQ